jgi:DNA-binding NarL/FixJ family response regulator
LGVGQVRSVVVADPSATRDEMVPRLRDEHGIEVAAVAHDHATCLLQARRVVPEVVVISARLRGSLRDVCEELRGREPRPMILLVDGDEDEQALLSAIEAGIDGYLTRRASIGDLADGVRALARGETVVPPALLGPLLRLLIEQRRGAADAVDKLMRLTPREQEVLGLLVDGRDATRIAEELVISPETVRTHIERILRKLGVHSRAEAVALATRSGMGDRLERAVGAVLT